jgi:hypothetical protein
LLFAEPLQITPIHSTMDSDIYRHGKGAKKGWVITVAGALSFLYPCQTLDLTFRHTKKGSTYFASNIFNSLALCREKGR